MPMIHDYHAFSNLPMGTLESMPFAGQRPCPMWHEEGGAFYVHLVCMHLYMECLSLIIGGVVLVR